MIRKSIQSFAFLAILMLNVALTSSDNKPKTIIDELKEKFKEDTGNDLTSDTVDTYIKEIYSLLFLGIQLQNLEIVEYLVNDLDANVNLVYRDGRTPLDIAQIKLEDFTEFDYDKTNVKEAENAQAIVDVLLKKEAKHSESYKVEKLYSILEQIKMNQSSPSLNDENHELPSASNFLSFDYGDDDDFLDDESNNDDEIIEMTDLLHPIQDGNREEKGDDGDVHLDSREKSIIEKRAENEDDDREEKGDDDKNDLNWLDDENIFEELHKLNLLNINEQKIEELIELLKQIQKDFKNQSMRNASSLFKDSSIEFKNFLINPADRDQVLSELTNDLAGIDNNKNDDDDDDYSDDFDDDDNDDDDDDYSDDFDDDDNDDDDDDYSDDFDDDDDDFKNADVLSLL